MKHVHGLGIDESNHGKTPELIVGVLSDLPGDFNRTHATLTKPRNSNRGISNLLEKRDFKFVYVSEDDKQLLCGDYGVRLWGVYQLVNHFDDGLETVVVDGCSQEGFFDDLVYFLDDESYRKIVRCEVHGDQHYQAVNIADRIAYFLFKHHEKGELGRYNRSILDVHVRDDPEFITKMEERYIRESVNKLKNNQFTIHESKKLGTAQKNRDIHTMRRLNRSMLNDLTKRFVDENPDKHSAVMNYLDNDPAFFHELQENYGSSYPGLLKG